MKVILKTNIKKLGNVGDQVIVKDGFARNFLFPNNMALRNTKSNLEHFEKIKDEINLKENEKKQKALNLIKSTKNIKIEFTREADDKGQLYGAISKNEIINLFNENQIKVFSDDIKILQPIRNLGIHKIELNPYESIETELEVVVNKT